MNNSTTNTATNSNSTAMTATRIEYKGRVIVDSNRLEGWFMTECGTIAADNLEEVMYDIDNPMAEIDYEWEEMMAEAETADLKRKASAAKSVEAYWSGSPSAMVSASPKVYVQI
jgi:hypothetical protein